MTRRLRCVQSLLVDDFRPSLGDSGSSIANRTIVAMEPRRLRVLFSEPYLSPSSAARRRLAKGVNKGVAGVVDI